MTKLPLPPRWIQRFLGVDTRDGGMSAQCRRWCHVLHTPGLRLQTPTSLDLRIMSAAASDPQAQRWLGWKASSVIPERDLERLLASPGGEGHRVLSRILGRRGFLVAIDPSCGRVAGAARVDRETGEVGGWLAPRYRGHGLGSALFAGAAEFAHQHLGIPSVIAATETGNVPCIAALASAGFIPVAGPDSHSLPDGRTIPCRWLRHASAHATMCEA